MCKSLLKRMRVTKLTRIKIGSRLHHASTHPMKSPGKKGKGKISASDNSVQRWAIPTPESESSLEPTPILINLESESESESTHF